MGTLSGIEYSELEGSGRLVYTDDGVRGTRIFVVDWQEREAFCGALLGYASAVGHSPVRRQAAKFPGFDYLYCQNAESAGLGRASQGDEMISYAKAKIVAEYAPLNFGSSTSETDDYDDDEEEGRLHLEEVWDFAGEMVSVPGEQFTYSDTGDGLVEPVGVIVGTVELGLSSECEPELPREAIRSCLGKVNSSAWYGAQAGHVLFLGAAARRVITAAGARAWQISYRFRERQISWNKRLRGGEWVAVSPSPYQSCDFSVIV
jgi:hypothetical protein